MLLMDLQSENMAITYLAVSLKKTVFPMLIVMSIRYQISVQ